MNIKLTKEEICDILFQTLCVQECLDKDIRNGIMDKFANEPYYDVLVDTFDEISRAYFKLGFDVHNLITR